MTYENGTECSETSVYKTSRRRVITQTKEDEITNHVYHYTSLMQEAEDSVSKSEYIRGLEL